MTDWFTTLPGLHAKMWDCLSEGIAARNAPARQVTLSTVGPDGWPESRMVVLRAADPVAAALDIHTDLHSAKITSLRHSPRAAVHIWDEARKLQLRLTCTVTILSGPQVDSIWASVPDPSRQSYGITPAPGTPIATALGYTKHPDPATFAVLRCRIETADLVHLGDDHRRALFRRDDGWQGQWVAP